MYIYTPELFTYETTLACIRALISEVETDKTILIIWDNAPWHKKAKRLIEENDKYADIRSKVKILCLPAYSPDLNPIEQVWRIIRKNHTRNQFFGSLGALKNKLKKAFNGFAKPNETLRRLCNWKD